jgi:hypothetical protein
MRATAWHGTAGQESQATGGLKMKRILIAAAIASGAVSFAAMAEVGVSVSIGQPGFYGRLDIGDYPQPRLIYREPRVIVMAPMERPPIYLRVPPGHARHWDKHCREYNACNERVYFVQDDWYSNEYAPRYRERHAQGRGKGSRESGGGYQNDRGNGDDRGGRQGSERGSDHKDGKPHGQGQGH